MKHKLVFSLLAFLGAFCCLSCEGQVAAPPSIAPGLINYFSTFSAGDTTSTLILYNTDGTYVQVSSYYTSPFGNGTSAPDSGTYTYSIDPKNPSHAWIAYNENPNPNAYDNLYFIQGNSGTQEVPGSFSVGGLGLPTFSLSPGSDVNGGANVSNRCQLSAGAVAINGFVVQSPGPRWVLIRAVGTTLSNFGVAGVVTKPSFVVYDSNQKLIGTGSVWGADQNLIPGYSTIFALVGAFPLKQGSDETVLLVQLNPGAYTSVFSAASAGNILCEVYFLPF